MKPYKDCPTPRVEHYGIVNLPIDTRNLLARVVKGESKRTGYKLKTNEVMRVIVEDWSKRHGYK
jgi:hypothetical protein